MEATLKKEYSLAELRRLPGFDEVRHEASLVNETVEIRNGQPTVVYRTNPDITRAALKSIKIPAFEILDLR